MFDFDDVAEPSIRIYLSPEKKLRFKTTCVSQGRDMSDVANELIDKWLEENEKPAPIKRSSKPKKTADSHQQNEQQEK